MIRLAGFAALAVTFAARAAAADPTCTFLGSYDAPENWDTLCVASGAVPAGCEIDFVQPHALMNPPSSFTVIRNGQPISLAGQFQLLSTYDVTVNTIDVYSCDCARESGPVSYDRWSLTIDGLDEGDAVTLASDVTSDNAGASIGAPGTCPLTVWPTEVEQDTACDPCPQPTDMPNDPVDEPSKGPSFECSAGGPAGLLPLGLALGAVVRRRRRRR
jgi:uncharacterized protein (TIGR03382 family)